MAQRTFALCCGAGSEPALMPLIAISSTHLRVTGSKQLKSTATSFSLASLYFSYKSIILQSVDSRDATQGSRVFSEHENPSCAAEALSWWQSATLAEVPFSKTQNPHCRQRVCGVNGNLLAVDEFVSYFFIPVLALPLLVYLSWSNEGNKLYCCWCCWLLWLLSSVCKESVSALRTHRKRETFSITSTAVVKK